MKSSQWRAAPLNQQKRRIKCIVAYDGTNFSGWQSQPDNRTVQDELERALAALLKEPVKVTGAGRTDAGVHASGQVLHFDTEHPSIPDYKFREALNSLLPVDVRILSSEQASSDFHARFSATSRTYRYYIDPAGAPKPYSRLYLWQIHRSLDIRRLNTFARIILGTHDFSCFARQKDPSPSKMKTVTTSCFYRNRGVIVYEIAAPSFLWMMVRTLVGTIVEFARTGQTEAEFLDILNSRDRAAAGATAPPQGLFLERVTYE